MEDKLQPPFEDRAVAFLDVLGFSNLVKNAEDSPAALTTLMGLRAVLDSHMRFDNQMLSPSVPQTVVPLYTFISDSIIISSPLQQGRYSGLAVVAVKAIQIAQKLLEGGHLLRGGISTGPVWHDVRNIFGTGYIDAFKTEQRADHPRVVLSTSSEQEWAKVPDLMAGLGVIYEGRLSLDVLNPVYVRSAHIHGGIEDFYAQVRERINSNLLSAPLGSAPRAKWEWFAGFYNDALKRHGVNAESFTELPMPA
ncbi:hypothetical protein ACXIT0_03450 [Methylorubrum extorquens]